MSKKNSNKNKNTATKSIGFGTKRKKGEEVKAEEGERLTRKQIIILISVALAAVLISAVIIGAVIISRGTNNPNLLKSDLSKYIEISAEDYKNIDLNIPLDDVTDEAVRRTAERNINMLLTNYKTLNKDLNGAYDTARALALGDTVYIYYRGYTVDENGRQQDFDGSSNISGELTVLEVGTGKIIDAETGEAQGSFIAGFGESLVGVVPAGYSVVDKRRQGSVMAGDVIYLSYTVIGEDENEELIQNRRIDLSLPYIDEIYGEGFAEFFVGKNIGENLGEKTFRKAGNQTDTVYADMKVSFITRGTENNPVTIKVKFPANYGEESLRGAETYFDVFIDSACAYDVPALDDKIITEKFKVRADSLSAYEGKNLAEKYRAKALADARAEIEDSNFGVLSDRVWEHLMNKVKIIKLPKKTLEGYYDSYYSRIKSLYISGYYSAYYDTIDALAVAYLNENYGMGLSANSDWKSAIRELAEWDLTQNLLFYYIIREENMLPSDEECEKIKAELYDDILEYYIATNTEKLYSLDSAAYQKELEVLKGEINDYYDDTYFREEAYRYYGIRKIIELNTK